MLPSETLPERRLQVAFSILGQCLFYRVTPGLTALLLNDTELGALAEHERLAAHIADFSIAALTGSGDLTAKADIEWPLPTSLP